jgi:hemerythrin
MFNWKDEYSTGVEFIDEQHKKLFEIGNKVYMVSKDSFRSDKYDKIVEVIYELKDYTIFHFSAEEEYMREIGYRKFLSHKVYHDDFIEKIKAIDFNQMDSNQEGYISELLNFVYDWIVGHILERDKLIKPV